MGERTLVLGDVAVRPAPRTLMLAWGDWVGRAAAVFLAVLGALSALRRWTRPAAEAPAPGLDLAATSLDVAVLPASARVAAGTLRTLARASLLGMVAAVALGDVTLQANTLAQIRIFTTLFLVPEAAAWCVLRAFAARASTVDGALVLASRGRAMTWPIMDIASVEAWRLPIPGPGATLRLASGERWHLALARPLAFARALGTPAPAPTPSRAHAWAQATAAWQRSRLDRPLVKFVLFPLLLALPAFRLHQHIAYGDAFGEFYTFGLKAYLTTFALWWAAWIIGVVLCSAALRAAVEAGTLAGIAISPVRAVAARRTLERLALAALYLGLPAYLAMRLLGA